MEAEPPPENRHGDHPSTSGYGLGYFHLRLLCPAAPLLLLLRSDRLYSLYLSRRRGPLLSLLASPRRRHGRRRRALLLRTSGCVLRLTHRFSSADAVRVNGRPLLRGGCPADLAVGDEFSLLRRGARYGFLVEKFVSCERPELAVAEPCGKVLVLRAESLRKRLRAISESHDPLSFLRDSHCVENGSDDVPVKKAREDDDFLPLNTPINPAGNGNLLREDSNIGQEKLEHCTDSAIAKNDIDGLIQGSKGRCSGNTEQKECSNENTEQQHNEKEGCYSDGSTFFLNRLIGIGPDAKVEQHSGVTLPQLLHPIDSLERVFIATFTFDISWFLDYCKVPQSLPVTIACHNKERCWSASRESRTAAPFGSYPNLLLVYPQFPEEIAFGKDREKQGVACHHPKLLVLQRKDSMRVIVTSANLVPRQWHLITNTVWWQDFPCRTSPDYSALFSKVEEPKSDFASQLVSFIAFLINEVPSQSYWINEIAKYNFEGAAGYLIASVPGIYAHSPQYLESNFCLSRKQILHTKSADRMFLGSAQTSVVGLSHRFHIPSDAGSKLKALSVLLSKCHVNMHGTTEVILKRNTNIPADANAVSVLVADLDKFTEEDSVHLGFLPREVAKWVSPLSDLGFFTFSGFIYPREALEAAYGATNTKVQLLLYVSKGAEFSRISRLLQDEHLPLLCSLVASLKRSLGLWRLEEVLSHFKWPETLETDFFYSASSIGTSINPQFIASFASAAGKRCNQVLDSEESDPERTWQRLRSTGIFRDAIPHPCERIGHPMHVKVAQRRFESRLGKHSFGWTYCGSHNFSPAAWGQQLPPPKANPTEARAVSPSPRLHICNYELGIVLIIPPSGMSKQTSGRRHEISDITLPFVVPPPQYKPGDKPATSLAMREAMAEARILQSNELVDLSQDTDEDIPDEDDEHVIELSDCSPEEKEEEKIYAETLWEQVDSSQSQGKDQTESGRCGCFAWNLCSPPKIHRVKPHATPEATRHSHRKYGQATWQREGSKPPTQAARRRKIVVLGGSGFVGSAICKAAVSKGIEVVSLSRSGRPSYSDPWVDQVTWLAGDVFYARWDEVLVGATAVVSTLGGFGNEEQMKRINGEANVTAVDAAKEFGIPKFILISVHDYNLPSFLLNSGYFTGKRKAESEVLSKYPTSGVVLRPGFIYGKRKVDGFEIPLDVVGQPLEKLLSSVENFTKPLSSLPASDLLLAPPVSVDDVAYAVINGVIDDSFFGVFTIEQIKEAATKVRA
uniref:NAD(P)-binding domain-containing protein n=1 Tax=Oryza punctata TaxID=4537 RepID=A0A0E0KQ54_ORYPU